MNVTCTRKLQFCAGHRVMGHESKCSNLHGHNYLVFITAMMAQRGQEAQTDTLGRVVDFSVIKEKVGAWIDKNWDHGFILYDKDLRAQCAIDFFDENEVGDRPGKQKLHLLPYNPTAENMARHLLQIVCPVLFKDSPIIVTEITLWETENCYATVKL